MPIYADTTDYWTPPVSEYVEVCAAEWWKGDHEVHEHKSVAQEHKSNSEKVDSEKFVQLAEIWKEQTKGLSSVVSMIMHPSYLEIISYGDKMIPYILKDLQKGPSHWFIALKTLNKNISPVRPEDAGNIQKMTEAWLNWGKDNGHIE